MHPQEDRQITMRCTRSRTCVCFFLLARFPFRLGDRCRYAASQILDLSVRLKTDEYCESLVVDGNEVYAGDGETFDLVASDHGAVLLSEIPIGIQVQLCDRVIGSSRDLYTREPHAIFKNSAIHGLVAQLSAQFFPPTEESKGELLTEYFEEAISAGEHSLRSIQESGRVYDVSSNIYDCSACLSYCIKIHDQTLLEAESFAAEIAARVEGAFEPPTLFLCHASEDKSFVDRVALELDKRALFAWYDKREIFVGDSIVEKVNDGLKTSDFLIAVLSPRSIGKPWVVREMSSTLMRQLDEKGIRILPLVMETCEIPPLLVDLKYADFRSSFDAGFRELLAAIQR